MANALTAIRLLLAYPFAFSMTKEDTPHTVFAAVAMVVAIATDLLDGPIARKRGTATAFGGTLDHATDFVFVTGGLAGGAMRGAFPWTLPLLITTAFAQYVIDSYWLHRRHQLRGSRLGRYNGILYFAPLCGDILIRLGLSFLRPLLLPVVWLLVGSTLLSIGQRLLMSGRLLIERSSRPLEKDQTDGGVKEDKEIVLNERERRHLTRSVWKEHNPEQDRN